MSREKENKGWGLGEVLAAAVGVGAALLAVGAVGASIVNSQEKENAKQKSKLTANAAPWKYKVTEFETIILTIDARPKGCGGYLRLPHSRTIYYYSVDWTGVFKFPNESDKFEMTNAFIALNYFLPLLQSFRGSYQQMFVKTDNPFFGKTYTGSAYEAMKMDLDSYMEAIGAEFRHVLKRNDEDMKKADNLSRQNQVVWPVGYTDKKVLIDFEKFIPQILSKIPNAVKTSSYK